MQNLRNSIFSIQNNSQFEEIALRIFQAQYLHNPIYQKYCNALKITPNSINTIKKIPYLPVEIFKSNEIITQWPNQTNDVKTIFTSSGTTGQINSQHFVTDLSIYENSFLNAFKIFYGTPNDFCFLALLPSYLERKGSSLVYMADKLITLSKNKDSGFYLNNLEELKTKIEHLKRIKQKTILLGVTYALLDLAELNIALDDNFTVMETGGMKGKRPELLKEELHKILCTKFSINKIHSEYGMTELLSQAYSKGDGIFETPAWMKILVRDPNDPTDFYGLNKTGAINIIDLANINSCAFIATKDLGKLHTENTFEVLGRMDNSDLRGCNLMMV